MKFTILGLIVVGAVHIAQPLVQMAKMAGYDVVLCDPRDSFASAERFPVETFLDGCPMRRCRDMVSTHELQLLRCAMTPKLTNLRWKSR